ncbi:response regulator receiver and ANTAR domain-containing protein [Alcanivorax sp. S71-1-4]|uniref:nitrate regulatory protein n=1 Tax=Alcanivorax sp. S71-1-4 TaxID=1177159 RepID=UPI00135A4AC5|nr:nitrate regulatory protein [Alcanivorax sp. S71-1-4]KAF0809204.1 response regulator receiver and ANTAR domain-containing protein [Alcanivorax sp. S71-1-4]
MHSIPPEGRRRPPSATDFLIASRQSEMLSLEAFLGMGRLVVAVSNLVHALQRERGASNLYLGAHGRRHGDRLAAMSADVDAQRARFDAALAALDHAGGMIGGSRLFSRLAYCVHTLAELPQVRDRVQTQTLTPEEAVRCYSELVRGLLAVVFEAAENAADPAISRTLVAMFNFMQGKELAGQERAAGCAGFARGEVDNALSERLLHLLEAQERCFQIFESFADEQALRLWQVVQGAPAVGELERLRRLACTAALRDRAQVDETLSDRWFELTTERIDAMKSVEDYLESRLHGQCADKLAEAREGLVRHQSLVESALAQEAEHKDAYIVFCGTQGVAGQPDSYHSDGVSPRLGRSIIELVQLQSQRLQAMQDELNAARTALDERKLMERAKVLLMKHRKLTEEQAYRLLRQMAMNQSRRLVDVARAVVSMQDVWE